MAERANSEPAVIRERCPCTFLEWTFWIRWASANAAAPSIRVYATLCTARWSHLYSALINSPTGRMNGQYFMDNWFSPLFVLLVEPHRKCKNSYSTTPSLEIIRVFQGIRAAPSAVMRSWRSNGILHSDALSLREMVWKINNIGRKVNIGYIPIGTPVLVAMFWNCRSCKLFLLWSRKTSWHL